MTIGDNHANEELRRRARALCDVLDQIAELQEDAKEIKGEAKADGYDMKAFAQIVKEMRRGPDYQADQLQLELVLDTYRRAVDLPVTLDAAQEAAREAAGATPEPRRGRSLEDELSDPKFDGVSMSVNGGDMVELGTKRRRKGVEGSP